MLAAVTISSLVSNALSCLASFTQYKAGSNAPLGELEPIVLGSTISCLGIMNADLAHDQWLQTAIFSFMIPDPSEHSNFAAWSGGTGFRS